MATNRLLPVWLLPLLILSSAPSLHAQVIKVDTTLDDVALNGNCTLREAIIAANTDTAVDRCPAGSQGDDTIVLRAGTYTLSLTGPRDDAARSGDLDIAGDSLVIIRGAGAADTIIDGGAFEWPDSDRVIHVLHGSFLMVSGVTVRGGVCWNGGGIFNDGWLSIKASRIESNVTTYDTQCGEPAPPRPSGGGAGIFNLGELTVSGSVVSGNIAAVDTEDQPGGGLLNQGAATIEGSLVAGNNGASGGGIENLGYLRLIDSTVDGNFGRFWGAGLRNRTGATAFVLRSTISRNADGGILNGGQNSGEGGGTGTLILETSTVSGNYSFRIPGSVINWGGSLDIRNSTIADNYSIDFGAGIGSGAPVHLYNTIVANPERPYQGGGDCAAPIVSLGNNLDLDGSCGLIASHDLPNTDPLLGPLADNGGPTLTHAITVDSPARDHTYGCSMLGVSEATDQRGVARPAPKGSEVTCDIGAYELSPTGDLVLIAADVQSLHHVLTHQQILVLLQPLQVATTWIARALNGDLVCQALDDFETLVSRYVSQQILTPVEAQPLLDGAQRVQKTVCR